MWFYKDFKHYLFRKIFICSYCRNILRLLHHRVRHCVVFIIIFNKCKNHVKIHLDCLGRCHFKESFLNLKASHYICAHTTLALPP